MAVKVGVFLADGLEMIEGLTVVDCLRRAGFEVTTISIMPHNPVVSGHDVKIYADAMFDDVDFDAFDAVVLPGGGVGTQNLGAHAGVVKTIKEYDAAGKVVAAICAAPTVLSAAGLLEGKKATCYPGCEAQFTENVIYTPEPAVTEGNIITGRSMGQAIPFSLALITKLAGEELANQIKEEIVY